MKSVVFHLWVSEKEYSFCLFCVFIQLCFITHFIAIRILRGLVCVCDGCVLESVNEPDKYTIQKKWYSNIKHTHHNLKNYYKIKELIKINQ